MDKTITLTTPLDNKVLSELKAGDLVRLNGVIYTGRDAAHKRMIDMLERGEKLPFDVEGQIIYYTGPCPEKPGEVIGSCGPTTSGRMDAYAPALIKLGLKGMIGKGLRDDNVINAMKEYGSIYFGATGGAGALIANSVVSQEIIAFEELGTEAIRKMVVKDFPVVVVIDSKGNDLYKIGRERYSSGRTKK